MKITIYQVDAFASEIFRGNPAAVCPLEGWIDDGKLQSIAAENNLSETAFLVPNEEGFQLRWFTPNAEVALCGHATLASAFVLFHLRDWPLPQIRFQTRQSGVLTIEKHDDLMVMDFPARPVHSITPPDGLTEAFGVAPRLVFGSAEDLFVVLDSEKTVREVEPNFHTLERMEYRGTIITAPGERCDFVSRFFAPLLGIPEDPVTGSAHCVLIPYWAGLLGKKSMRALQVSRRGGELFCTHAGDRVKIAGRAALYMEGTITF